MKKLFIILSLLFPVSLLAGNKYYLNVTSGSDAGAGTFASPWATKTRLNAIAMAAGDTIFLNGEDRFPGPFYFPYSGSASGQIVVTSYGTGQAILEGFESLTGFTTFSGSIMQATCITCQPTVRMVRFFGNNQAQARWPNYNTIDGGYLKTTATTSTTVSNASIPSGTAYVGAHMANRINEYTINNDSITGQTAGQFMFTGETTAPTVGFGFFVMGAIGCIDQNGEWIWDNSARKLKIQVASTPTGPHDVDVSAVDTIATVTGSYITFRNITFEGANQYDIAFIANANNDSLINCNINFSGINGVEISKVTSTVLNNIGIIDCNFGNIANNGISATYPAQVYHSKLYLDSFYNIAMVPGAGGGGGATNTGINWFGSYDTLDRIDLYNIGGPGLAQYGGDTNYYHFIHARYTGQVTGDVGAIYFSVHSGVRNTFDHCVMHDCLGNNFGTDQPKPIYGNGLYLDSKATNVFVKKCTFYNNSSHGLFLHMTRNCLVDSCVSFGNGQDGMYLQEDGGDPSDTASNNTVTNSQFIAFFGAFAFTWYAFTYNNIQKCFINNDHNIYARPIKDDSTFRNNGGAQQKYTLANWKSLVGQDGNSTRSPLKISDDSKMILFVNTSFSDSTIIIPQAYVNVYGARQIAGSYTLHAFESLVLLPQPLLSIPFRLK